MADLIERQAAIDVALTFFVEFLGGAFHEDDQRKLIALYEQLPSAVKPKTAIDVHNKLIGYDSFRE